MTTYVRGSVVALLLTLLMSCGNAVNWRGPQRYYIDFARGDDANPGTSNDKPWKHAPGDPEATGKPASKQLAPGDHVVFAAGVVYRGEIAITESGGAEAPIVFEGAPGAPAMIDGSDPVAFTHCPSAVRCGGLANWSRLVLITLPSPLPSGFRLFADRGQMRPARAPDPKDDFYADEPDDMLSASPDALGRGEVELPPSVGTATAGFRRSVAVWVQPNVVVERSILDIADGVVRFNAAALKQYTDRPGRYAVIGVTGALDRPGEYVVLPDGRQAVAMLPANASSLSIASGRGGFRLEKASHVAIRNLTFRHMTDGGETLGGIAVLSNLQGNRGVEITGNRFVDMDMPQGNGPVILVGASNVRISDNSIERIAAGSGIRVGGPAEDVTITGNRITRIGRTGIMLTNVSNALVERNLISDVRGVHGNGMSAYLGNYHVRFIHNTVLDAKLPVTFHGAQPPSVPLQSNDLEFRENLLIADPESPGSLIAWGEVSRDIVVTGNVLLGGRAGLRIPPGNRAVTVVGNVGMKPSDWSRAPLDWSQEGNHWFAAPPPWASRIRELAAMGAEQVGKAKFDCRALFDSRKIERIGANIECAP